MKLTIELSSENDHIEAVDIDVTAPSPVNTEDTLAVLSAQDDWMAANSDAVRCALHVVIGNYLQTFDRSEMH
jgi:hypothetical protein